MRSIGARVHELRIREAQHNWRIDEDRILIVAVFAKTTRATPRPIIDACKARLKRFDNR
jgi:phage-related protein